MNLNLSSVFNISALKEMYHSESQSINIDTLIKMILTICVISLVFWSGSITEYLSVFLVFYPIQKIYSAYIDIANIDLHFSNDDLELSEIINDLWN